MSVYPRFTVSCSIYVKMYPVCTSLGFDVVQFSVFSLSYSCSVFEGLCIIKL